MIIEYYLSVLAPPLFSTTEWISECKTCHAHDDFLGLGCIIDGIRHCMSNAVL